MSNYKCPGCGKVYTTLDAAIECASKDSMELKAKESSKEKVTKELKSLKDHIYTLYDEMTEFIDKYNSKAADYRKNYSNSDDYDAISAAIYTSETVTYDTDDLGNSVKISFCDLSDLKEKLKEKKGAQTSTVNKTENVGKYKPTDRKFKKDEKANTTSAAKPKTEKKSDIERLKSRYEDLYSKFSASDKKFIDDFNTAFEKTLEEKKDDDFDFNFWK